MDSGLEAERIGGTTRTIRREAVARAARERSEQERDWHRRHMTGSHLSAGALKAAVSNRSNFEAVPDSMRDRIAYRDIDLRSNSLVVAIDRDEPPTPTDQTVPVSQRPIESLDLPRAAEALKELL